VVGRADEATPDRKLIGRYPKEMGGYLHRHPGYRAPLAITGLFVISRIAFLLAGVRFDMTALTGQFHVFQLLDLDQLHHNLVQSIWYLHSQPPIFNLFSGLVLQLPGGAIRPLLIVVSLALGLGLALSSYYLCLELCIPSAVSLVVAAVVVLDPANVLYGNWYFYSFPTAALMTFCALCLAHFVRTRLSGWGVGFFACLMAVVLLNSTFQWFWLLAAGGPVVVVLRQRWRQFLAIAVVPLLLVSVWYIKNADLFQTYTTSSWFGMNFASTTTAWATPSQIRQLIAKHELTPIAGVAAFLPLSAYGRTATTHRATGVAALDQPTKGDGSPNFNNINYIGISNQFLHNDLAFLKAHPGNYTHAVKRGATLFFVPSDQYFYLGPNSRHISSYVRAFDLLVDWQPRSTTITTNGYDVDVTFEQVSISALITFAVAIVATPFVVWRRRRDAPFALVMAFMWVSIVYVFAATTLVQFGENQRFKYDLGPLPLVAAVAVVTALVTRIRGADPRPKQ
jgi:hypothetical protein